MSILSDRDIRRALDSGSIRAQDASGLDWDALPEEPWRVQPCSFEVTLSGADDSLMGYALDPWSTVNAEAYRTLPGASLRTTLVHHAVIDPEDPPPMVVKPWWLPEGEERRQYLLQPGEFLLASTAESITIGRSMCAAIEGKSSLGRMGLMIHATARFVDSDWSGRLTLELFNAAPRPIRLRAGMRIGQLRFERLSSPSERGYGDESLGSHYLGSESTVQGVSVKYEAPDYPGEPLGFWGAPTEPMQERPVR